LSNLKAFLFKTVRMIHADKMPVILAERNSDLATSEIAWMLARLSVPIAGSAAG
jgi:hypothetical protein